MSNQSFSPIFAAFVALVFFGEILLLNAQEMQERTPPKEAITACQNKDKGTTCSITTPEGDTLSGTCSYTPDEKYFVCMPEGGPKAPPKR
jgi:hypothetical protein